MKRTQGLIVAILFPFCMYSQTSNWDIVPKTGRSSLKYSDTRLLSFDNDTLNFANANTIGRIPIDSISSLTRETGGDKALRSVLIGAVSLGAGGLLVGFAIDNDDNAKSTSYSSSSSQEGYMKIVLPIAGVALGAGLGAALAPATEITEIDMQQFSHDEKVRTISAL
ncbi:MAG: hypothetical protein HY961_13240, partial [Ignavibacteriae bacterium]|nr:hypothetical protein [Ignavibacteriota bacterium]